MDWLNFPYLTDWLRKPDTQLEQDLQQVIQHIDPLLQYSRGYPRLYRKALLISTRYIDQLVAQIPGPIPLSALSFTASPLVKALFASTRELEETLKLSVAMQQFQPEQGAEDCAVYALLGVRFDRNTQLGLRLEGETVQRDILQHSISFRDHTFTLPATSDSDARQLIRQHLLLNLANSISERRAELKQQCESLQLLARKKENERRLSPQPAGSEIDAEIKKLWSQWRSLNQLTDTDHSIVHFEQIMRNPSEYLWFEPIRLTIDDMGIERPVEQGGKPIDLINLHGADRRIWSIMLVQFQWQTPPSPGELLKNASRWLRI